MIVPKNLKFILMASIFYSCQLNNPKTVRVKNETGLTFEGQFFKDSLFHGLVKFYDSGGNYIGYTNYNYGLENGAHVIYSKPNLIKDSINYVNGLENGYAYKYDALGRLKYRVFYFHGLTTASTTMFDSSGKIIDYYFLNLDGDLLYSSKPVNDSLTEDEGSLINVKVNSVKRNEISKDQIFLYILDVPFYKSHYEIAIMGSSKKIISSNRISSNNFYYEQELDNLPNGMSYAIVFHKYNKFKGRDDLIIQLIK